MQNVQSQADQKCVAGLQLKNSDMLKLAKDVAHTIRGQSLTLAAATYATPINTMMKKKG